MMRALREFTYAQQRRRAGDCFNVNSQQHVSALQEAKLAEVNIDTHEPVLEQHYVASAITAEDPAPIVTKRKPGRQPKGSYKRKDLVAE